MTLEMQFVLLQIGTPKRRDWRLAEKRDITVIIFAQFFQNKIFANSQVSMCLNIGLNHMIIFAEISDHETKNN